MERPVADRVRFILVRPQHPGNIGATARALKNMGFSRLVIVADEDPDLRRAESMATHGADLLATAEIHRDLDSALQGVVWAVATTCRPRQWRYQHFASRELGGELWTRALDGDVAILFGQEDYGLDNDAVNRCQAVVEIPTAGMKSLNLAQAVLVIAYDLLLSRPDRSPKVARVAVDLTELEPVVERWVESWRAVGYLKGRNPEQFTTTLRQILGRAALDDREVTVLRGYFNKLHHYLRRTGGLDGDG